MLFPCKRGRVYGLALFVYWNLNKEGTSSKLGSLSVPRNRDFGMSFRDFAIFILPALSIGSICGWSVSCGFSCARICVVQQDTYDLLNVTVDANRRFKLTNLELVPDISYMYCWCPRTCHVFNCAL